jgi:hypothetical protein
MSGNRYGRVHRQSIVNVGNRFADAEHPTVKVIGKISVGKAYVGKPVR